jgi:N-acetylglucosaminyldiphosphoundecaprenol N-acetyl-beta-D-mannosaminyltransferase
MLREPSPSLDDGVSRPGGRALLAGLQFHSLTEAQVVERIVTASRAGRGGWVATPNVDICRQARYDKALLRLVSSASLIVPDGMPLIWAARLVREPLPERVTGSSLIFSLTQAAACQQRSIYLLGGAPGVPERAGEELRGRYPGLVIAGTDAPPTGFDTDPQAVAAVHARLAAASPDIVYVGLGFPKQERLIARLAPSFPGTWFISCGAAIPFAANALPRAPQWMQSAGLEWTFRLISEPRRLYRRYLLQDLPFAVKLLAGSAMVRLRKSGGVAHMDQSNHEYRPLRAESRAAEMGSGPLADGSAGPSELLVTPPDLPAGSLPVSPAPIASGLSVTDSTQRLAMQVWRIRSRNSR